MAKKILIALALSFLALAGCDYGSPDVTGEPNTDGRSAVLLPPGFPGAVEDGVLVLDAEEEAPAIRFANCFAGVDNVGDFGIGGCAGCSLDFVPSFTIPVNLNLGASVLGSYKVQITSSDPSLQIVKDGISGSQSKLSDGCLQRDCPSICANNPDMYPPQFERAYGFEDDPAATGDSVTVTVEDDADLGSSPTAGVVNLFNVPVKIVSELPEDGVELTFTILELKDPLGTDLTASKLDGVVIEKFQLQ